MPPELSDDVPPASPEELDSLTERIDAWLAVQLVENPVMEEAERAEPRIRRWRVRMAGDEKDFTTVWLILDQRTLTYESYVMPAPEENHGRFYEHLLRRNQNLYGMAFTIGDEDAVFLRGQLPVTAVDEGQLDRIIGSFYAYVEQCFRPALRIGFASHLG